MLVVVFYGSELNYFCDPQTTENKQMQTVFKMMCFTNIGNKAAKSVWFSFIFNSPIVKSSFCQSYYLALQVCVSFTAVTF